MFIPSESNHASNPSGTGKMIVLNVTPSNRGYQLDMAHSNSSLVVGMMSISLI